METIDQLRAVLDALPSYVCCVDRDYRFQFVNHAYEVRFGTTASELIGRRADEVVGPIAFAERKAFFEAAFAGRHATFEGLLPPDAKGRRLPMEGHCVPLRDESGRVDAVVAIFIPKSEAAIAQARFRDLLESAPDAMVIVDADGRIELVNSQAETLFGYARAELVGHPVEMLVPERLRASHPEHRDDYRREPRPRRMGAGLGLSARRKDGSEFPAEISLAPMTTSDGPLVTASIRDVTEQRKADAAFRAMQARLAVSDRMASLGTLAAGVAHEINNPLTYVTTNLELVAEAIRAIAGGSPSGRLRDLEALVTAAREGTERVKRIVRELRTFSRPEEERKEPLDARRVLDVAVNIAATELRHRARLVKDYGPMPLVEADEARLGQVFINLLVNAAQAIPEGRADQNEVRIVTSTDTTGRAVVEIRDTGRGIDAETLRHVFDPFFTTKPIGEGTGLGLSICHGIVTALGGEVDLTSEVGVGTVARVILPPALAAASVETARRGSARPSAGQRGRVLVVDDDAYVGASLGRILEDEHDVTIEESAKAALARIVAGETFDVILCDLMMPEMSGMDLHAALSNLHPTLCERMVFITGGAFTPAARSFLDEVPNQRVEKPYTIQNIRAIVRTFVR